MSILNRTASRVKSQASRPAPVATTVIRFDATRRHRAPRSFGVGVVTPTRYSNDYATLPFSQADLDWARDSLFASDEPTDAEVEEMYEQSAMLDRYTSGHLAI